MDALAAMETRIARLEQQTDSLEITMRGAIREMEERIKNVILLAEGRAAQQAIHEAFAKLGIDVNDPKDMQAFRDDLRFGGVFRAAVQKGLFAVVAAVFGGVGLSVWLLFKERIGLP